MTDTLLWIAQGLVAAVAALTGGLKLVVPKARLETRMHWAASWPAWRVKALGLAEVAGALGLVLPAWLGLPAGLTPLAALCLAVLMGGAIATHRRLGEGFAPAAVVGLLCLVVVVGRLA